MAEGATGLPPGMYDRWAGGVRLRAWLARGSGTHVSKPHVVRGIHRGTRNDAGCCAIRISKGAVGIRVKREETGSSKGAVGSSRELSV